jgi:hypothetical protein
MTKMPVTPEDREEVDEERAKQHAETYLALANGDPVEAEDYVPDDIGASYRKRVVQLIWDTAREHKRLETAFPDVRVVYRKGRCPRLSRRLDS